jgi:hypothetical protein
MSTYDQQTRNHHSLSVPCEPSALRVAKCLGELNQIDHDPSLGFSQDLSNKDFNTEFGNKLRRQEYCEYMNSMNANK